MDENIIKKVVQIVSANIQSISEDFQDLDTELSQFGMDSIVFIRIVVALEDAFGMEVPDKKLLMTEMGTIQKMAEVVCAAL